MNQKNSQKEISLDGIEKNFGEPRYTLKLYRNRTGLTQKQLAEKLKIHQHHISEMETGKRGISKSMARKLGHLFSISYREFI